VPRPSNTAQRRAEIVAAAIAVIAGEGYERATTGKIAAAAGLSSGLLHYHFASKLEILLAVIEALRERVTARMVARVERAAEPRARLRAYIDAMLSLDGGDADPSAVAIWVVLGAESLRSAEVAAAFRKAMAERHAALLELVGDVLIAERGHARGRSRIAAGIFAQIEGSLVLASTFPGGLPSGYAATTAWRVAEALLEQSGG
jgi:TetR/AcrR family transcriptional regulator, transcriptional repressor of bet genes